MLLLNFNRPGVPAPAQRWLRASQHDSVALSMATRLDGIKDCFEKGDSRGVEAQVLARSLRTSRSRDARKLCIFRSWDIIEKLKNDSDFLATFERQKPAPQKRELPIFRRDPRSIPLVTHEERTRWLTYHKLPILSVTESLKIVIGHTITTPVSILMRALSEDPMGPEEALSEYKAQREIHSKFLAADIWDLFLLIQRKVPLALETMENRAQAGDPRAQLIVKLVNKKHQQ